MANKTMTISDISKTSKQFKDTHTLQVGGFKDGGGRVSNKELLIAINKINNRLDQHEHIIKDDLLIAINKINDRLDKHEHIIKNDLLIAINKINDRLDKHEHIIKDDLLIAINKINDRLDKHEQMLKIIFDRIDNLVAKNNLKE